jgi:Ca2+:H+ antiporter
MPHTRHWLSWSTVLPIAAVLLLVVVAFIGELPKPVVVLAGLGLAGGVAAAVHHAEVIAHRVGEPFGTLVLALAVTVIEASLILSMMVAGGSDMAVLPRDTMYAAVMIICNGVVGLCLLVGGLAHREQVFRVEGSGAGLAALIVMASLTLVLPTFTVSAPGASYTPGQMLFAAFACATLWAVFIFIQTVRHRDYFLPTHHSTDEDTHAAPPSARATWASALLLLVSLVAVVGLAKMLSPTIERMVLAAGAPRAVVGIVIAMLVLLPETVAAARAARANRLQTSMNLALGSALASIGLTIPVVVIAALSFDLPLSLGLEPKEVVLLGLTFLVNAVTLGSGRTHMMQGAVHLVLFAAFLFLAVVP